MGNEPHSAPVGAHPGAAPTLPHPAGPVPLLAPSAPADAPLGPLYGARYGGAGGALPAAVALSPLTYRPGVITLRPLGAGDLIDGAVRTLRARPAVFLGVGAIFATALTVLRTAIDALVGVTYLGPDGSPGVTLTPSVMLPTLLAALLAGILAPPIAQAVLGRSLDPTVLWSMLRPRLPALLGYLAVVTVAVALPTVLLWSALGGRRGPQGDLVLALLGLVALGELVRVPFVGAPAVIVLEGQGPLRAVRRSWSLARRSYWRVLTITLLGKALVALVTAAFMAPLLIGAQALSSATGLSPESGQLVSAGMTLLAMFTTCLTAPFDATLRLLLYVDLRVRSEGLDVLLVDAAHGRARTPTPGPGSGGGPAW